MLCEKNKRNKMKYKKIKFYVLVLAALICNVFKSYAQETVVEINVSNPQFERMGYVGDNVDITTKTSIDEILKKVDFLYATRSYEEAINLCNSILQMTEDSSLVGMVYFKLSSLYIEKANVYNKVVENYSMYEDAISFAEKSLTSMPDNWQAYANIASAYTNMQKYQLAIDNYKKAQTFLNENDVNYLAIEQQLAILLSIKKVSNKG